MAAVETTTTPASPQGAHELLGLAEKALGVTQQMSESVRLLIKHAIEFADATHAEVFPLLSAMEACLDKLDGQVDPAVDALFKIRAVASHG